jgi:ABC-2 type transport system permease protein
MSSTSTTYIRYELLRTFRNRRFFVFSFGFPLVLYFVIAAPNRHVESLGGTGISAPLYYMVGLAAFGSMNAMLATGARIAAERSTGWNRQLRITPLSVRTYFRAKVLTSYLVAIASLLLLFLAGATLGVRLPAGEWTHMTWLMLVGLIPFAVMGILIGHLVTAESIGPVIGGSVALFALLGGTWFPITGNGVLHAIAQLLPSYWLVQASHIAIGGVGWGARGWIVVAAWTAGLVVFAVRAYRRDTKRT